MTRIAVITRRGEFPLQRPNTKQFLRICRIDDTRLGQLRDQSNIRCYGRFNVERPVTDMLAPKLEAGNWHTLRLRSMHLSRPLPATVLGRLT